MEAEIDLEQALRHGVDPAAVHYDLALVHLALRDPAAGQWHLDQALKYKPEHPAARALQQRLRQAR